MGLSEAERSGRPILLVAGTPHCAGVSGTWCPGKQEMDRNFLSQVTVIEASRKFVCVRLLTYEDAAEAKFLKSLFLGGSGDLENTLFAILAPDGKKVLVRAHRSPHHDFEDAAQLADTMNRVARTVGEPKMRGDLPLPLVANVRLALNTAACDGRPLVAIVSEDAQVRQRLEGVMASLAWSEANRGRFMYVSAAALKGMSIVKGMEGQSAVLVIQPDRFGLGGTVLAQTDANAAKEQMAEVLAKGLALHKPGEQEHRDHVREGHRQGIFWETVIPVTDPWEQRARERGRSQKASSPDPG